MKPGAPMADEPKLPKWEPTQWQIRLAEGFAQIDFYSEENRRRNEQPWQWEVRTPHFRATGQAGTKEAAFAAAEANARLAETAAPKAEVGADG